MPYSATHKQQVRSRIVESARVLFNRHGFEGVTIDSVMEFAGLTRGGFYNHFKSKDKLYSEAVSSFLMGQGAKWRDEAGIDPSAPDPETARKMIRSYLSEDHLNTLDNQCPMIALPSDVARAKPKVQEAYQQLLEAMVSLFEQSLGQQGQNKQQKNTQKKNTQKKNKEARLKALSLSALCVGGMILARTLPDSALAKEIQAAARITAEGLTS